MSTSRELLDMGFTQEPFPVGAHVCLIYQTEEERRDLMAKFLEAGLRDGERVLYLTDVMKPGELLDWLSDLGVEIPSGADEGRFSVVDAESVYCKGGEFIPDRMFDYWGALYDDSVAKGYPAVRATGETSWAVRGIPGSDRLVEYEALLNKALEKVPVTAVCQYDAKLFDGATILDVLRVHPVMISRGQLVKNPFYIGPDEFLALPRR
ncbi:MAG: MEDS domain-containing protein [Actinobacteria bacterium]|nr:MEDS domain-containing protein [Actinomycetota bacterium]